MFPLFIKEENVYYIYMYAIKDHVITMTNAHSSILGSVQPPTYWNIWIYYHDRNGSVMH